MDQLSRLQTADLRQHMDQDGILDHVPVVGGQHILGTLVQDRVQRVAADIEGHGIGAGIKSHFMEVCKIVEVGQDASAGGVVLQVVQYPVHLVKLPLRVDVLHAQLIAVGLADGAVLVGPAIPDMTVQVMDIVGFFLPDPQKLVNAGFIESPPQGHNGEFLPQIIAVDDAKAFDRVGRRTVLPAGTHLLVRVPDALREDLSAGLDIFQISLTHIITPLTIPNRRRIVNTRNYCRSFAKFTIILHATLALLKIWCNNRCERNNSVQKTT